MDKRMFFIRLLILGMKTKKGKRLIENCIARGFEEDE